MQLAFPNPQFGNESKKSAEFVEKGAEVYAKV